MTATTSRRSRASGNPHARSSERFVRILGVAFIGFFSTLMSGSATAQDWGSENDAWSQPTVRYEQPQGGTGWDLKLGLGFTDDPNTLLLYFEAPYSFDQWVAIGPALQIGIDDHNTIVAPTVNLTVNVPLFDRVRPYGFAGVGFAYLRKDNRPGSDDGADFLINCGFGLEYQLSARLSMGSTMIFNFIPNEVINKNFFYSWQVLGVRIAL